MVENVLLVYVDFIIMTHIFSAPSLESTHSIHCETESATFSWHLLLIDKVAELCLLAYLVVNVGAWGLIYALFDMNLVAEAVLCNMFSFVRNLISFCFFQNVKTFFLGLECGTEIL